MKAGPRMNLGLQQTSTLLEAQGSLTLTTGKKRKVALISNEYKFKKNQEWQEKERDREREKGRKEKEKGKKSWALGE